MDTPAAVLLFQPSCVLQGELVTSLMTCSLNYIDYEFYISFYRYFSGGKISLSTKSVLFFLCNLS